MKSRDGDFRKALIALSFGLEPVIFAIVGWYAAPYFEVSNALGALIGVLVGFGMMFWRIWRFNLMVSSKLVHDVEREDLRSLASLIEVERYKIMRREDLIKIIGAQTPLQLLNILKSLSFIDSSFYDLSKLNEVLDEMIDFSKTLLEIRSRSPIDFLRILDDFNDFLACLCVNYAFRSEVCGDEISEGYKVPPFKSRYLQTFLCEEFKDYLANNYIKELYSKALSEALTLNSRAPFLALTTYSLMNMARDLEITRYSRIYAKDLKDLALRLLLIAIKDLKERKKTSEVMEITLKKWEVDGVASKDVNEVEEDVLKSFINEAYRTLITSAKVPLTAKTVISYLLIKWSEKVSLKLAIMAASSELDPQRAYLALLVPR